MTDHKPVTIGDVKEFWNKNPLASADIPYERGTSEYFAYYNKMRERNESVEFSYKLHEYKSFKGKKVLDVGSGNGYVLSKYAAEGAEVFGVDITETGIALCKKRFELLKLKGNFEVANAEELPFEDETFDCVCSMGVLHHVPNTEKAVSEIHRVLKPGGLLIVMFYNRDSAWYRIRMPLEGLIKGKSRMQLVDEVDGIGNPKGDVYSKGELENLLSGFKVNEIFAGLLNSWMILPFGGVLPDWLFKPLERKYGWFLYAKATKA